MSVEREQLVTITVGKQQFGVPAFRVREILRRQPLTTVPLAPAEISGVINLRGHIVVAIDVRQKLGFGARPEGDNVMCVVVDYKGESVCLLVDGVGDVVTIDGKNVEPNPASLQHSWVQLSRGICRTDKGLMILLQIDQLLAGTL
ncbi:MAG: chemotaxis protein CheW [Rhodobacteraceae bacterium]|nr:chemotaxis protein CheW [Paracoccaceae bacterium]